MKTATTCDDVFDQLTNPSTLSADERRSLADHAQRCSACQQLVAEVDTAAIWVRTVVTEPLATERRVASIMQRLQTEPKPVTPASLPLGLHRIGAWQGWAALAVALLVTLGAGWLIGGRAADAPDREKPARLLLASWGIPDRCLSHVFPAENSGEAAKQQDACCTECHTADDSKGLNIEQRALLARSCMACHVADG